ncbi:hypothetical protein MACK_003216 [Theileria orientalis]|uniref:Uncharacterized protein n=1 Tax=Theileria orientalis TaxID=68886 RepID=A0A976SIG6_THEOR|nr:hypothetical protein MACK_003216 [Theileria orientalis]
MIKSTNVYLHDTYMYIIKTKSYSNSICAQDQKRQ